MQGSPCHSLLTAGLGIDAEVGEGENLHPWAALLMLKVDKNWVCRKEVSRATGTKCGRASSVSILPCRLPSLL